MNYKNIVFDMGNVLIDYEPDRVIRQFTQNEVLIRKVSNILFSSSEWILLDGGLISEERAMKQILPRFDTEEERCVATESFAHWHEYNMYPKEGMLPLLKELKAAGHGLYVLSNASMRLPECYKTVIPGWELFDGILFSAEEKCLKPQTIIYEKFFERFSLKPSDCFFIDDLPQNIEGAAECGMDGYVFADGDVEKLRQLLLS